MQVFFVFHFTAGTPLEMGSFNFLLSQKGKLQLKYNGNVFVKEKSRLKKTYW